MEVEKNIVHLIDSFIDKLELFYGEHITGLRWSDFLDITRKELLSKLDDYVCSYEDPLIYLFDSLNNFIDSFSYKESQKVSFKKYCLWWDACFNEISFAKGYLFDLDNLLSSSGEYILHNIFVENNSDFVNLIDISERAWELIKNNFPSFCEYYKKPKKY